MNIKIHNNKLEKRLINLIIDIFSSFVIEKLLWTSRRSPIGSWEVLRAYGEKTVTLMNHKFYEALVYIVEAAVRQFLTI